MANDLVAPLSTQVPGQTDGTLDHARLSALCFQRLLWSGQVIMFSWAAVALGIAYKHGLSGGSAVAWLALFTTYNLASRQLFTYLPSWHQIPTRGLLHLASALSVLDGLCYSCTWLFVQQASDSELMVFSLFPLGCVAAVSTAGWRGTFLSYSLTLVPATALAWWPTGAHAGEWTHAALSASSVVFGFSLNSVNRNAGATFQRAFDANVELRQALKRADEANRAKTRFLAAASHDLRQPLYTLSLFCGALSTRNLDADASDMVRNMDVAIRSLSGQLDSLLDISKLDAGTVECKHCDTDLSALLERIRLEFEPRTLNKGLELIIKCPPGLMVLTDELLLERILRNLLDNAVKYTHQGEIKLCAASDGSQVELLLRDSGVGIPFEEQERVFEEFYQLHNPERDRAQGLGLGLSIVKRLSRLLGMDIQLRSEPGIGTEVQLKLPAVLFAAPLPLHPASREPAAPDVAGLHVLVVDDELAVRQGLHALLSGWGCHVTLSTGTDDAEACARALVPDVLLCDLRLRGDDNGLQTIRRLRSVYPEQAAIVITGDTAPDRLSEAHAAGVNLLHKPVPPDVLRRELAQAAGLLALAAAPTP